MTENKKEQELNDFFDGKSTSTISKVVKKAKRKTILRNMGISLFVIVFLLITLSLSWLFIIRGSQEKAMRDIELFSRITNPNIELLESQNESNGVFEGILTFNRYKEIEGIPVDWSNHVVRYSLFGGMSRFKRTEIQIKDKEDGLDRNYDRETKQRMMNFYHPDVSYSQIRNDLNTLNNFKDDTFIELGVSFNQKYTPDEVRELIPENITLKWYWVDTYSREDIKSLNTHITKYKPTFPELATEIYGFSEDPTDSSMSEKRFIDDVQSGLNYEDGKYFGEFNRIYNNLKGESAKLAAENIEIIGAVVTGTPKELAELNDMDMIRATVLGVTVKPY
ncbi:anti sigma factor C-terminal domain-containing protein [Viridibacillus arvi]|uniref:anti sigma factor C-terminal domain-containing protein n=1 Tax=Viridibacillus arvi TaxID=263475 RepID=UPI003D2CEDF6